ncbi:MAG: SRPBCC family protein [Gemmatimonadota bacterium]|nr:SRPBCC family protein [Gemmatimonadota bacterium]
MKRPLPGPDPTHACVDPDVGDLGHGFHLLRAVTVLDRPRDEVFPFFAAAQNLERITPEALRFRMLTPAPIRMRTGARIDYEIRLNGIPFRWRTEISVWDPPYGFTDTQIRGPYHTWAHRHLFENVGHGRTRMTDEVRYRLPGWPLGEVALPFVRHQLRKIFEHRNRVIRELLA